MSRLPRSLRVRLLGTLAVVVLVSVGLLTAVGWVIHAAAAIGTGTSLTTSAPIAAGVVVLAAAVLIVVHARYGYRRTLEDVAARPLDGGDRHGLEDRLQRFALAAGVKRPGVAVVESREATCFTVDNGTDATVVVTSGALEALSEHELDAVLAHEVAHLANRDTVLATVVATIGSISEDLFARERRLGEWIRFLLSISSVTVILLLVAVPIVVLLIPYLLVSVLARVVLAINAICIGLHAQAREYAADSAGAELVGDPTALAGALETLEGTTPRKDARSRHASATLGIVSRAVVADDESPSTESSVSRWIPDDDSELNAAKLTAELAALFGRVGRALEWRPATHPPTETRIERLLEMASETKSGERRAETR